MKSARTKYNFGYDQIIADLNESPGKSVSFKFMSEDDAKRAFDNFVKLQKKYKFMRP